MAGKTKVSFYRPARQQALGGEVVGEPTFWRSVWADKTENGGRTNLHASRIVHENSAVLTINYIDGLTTDMLVEVQGQRRPIESIAPEGFRKKLHIVITLNDLTYHAGY